MKSTYVFANTTKHEEFQAFSSGLQYYVECVMESQKTMKTEILAKVRAQNTDILL